MTSMVARFAARARGVIMAKTSSKKGKGALSILLSSVGEYKTASVLTSVFVVF